MKKPDEFDYIDHGYGPKPKNKPLQFKRGTAKAFWIKNPVLLSGQPAYELDTKKFKIGDGRTRYTKLPYIGDGKDGKSAYEIWKDQGYEGTIDDFLKFITGEAGKSAYEIWLALGNEGSMFDFIQSLHGEKGDKGDKGDPGEPGADGKDGVDGKDGADGKSAYQIWLDDGNEGTITDFLNSLKGKSAYEIWLDLGHQGTEADFIASLKGDKGDKGEQGNPGEKGDKGDKGDDGADAFEAWKKEMGDPTLTFDDFVAMLSSDSWVGMDEE